jgi:ribosomal protein L2|tara:strand:- start:320 stop:634 length:315 start_codon:yes stop_codon:yes gene_type:complete
MFTYFTKATSKSRRIFNAPTFHTLNQIKRTSVVSLLELLPGLGVQYCRSSGCKAKLTSTDFFKSTALVTLPSGIKKIFSLYSIASKGQVSLPFKKYFNNTKAGY